MTNGSSKKIKCIFQYTVYVNCMQNKKLNRVFQTVKTNFQQCLKSSFLISLQDHYYLDKI